jgi:uncharacterized paraquat-inducible protein A
MALIICPDCSTSVSDRAKVCPSCGRPISAKSFATGAFFYLGVILLGVIIYFALNLMPFVGIIVIALGAIGFIVTLLRKFLSL